MTQLSERQREVIELAYDVGLSQSEIDLLQATFETSRYPTGNLIMQSALTTKI